jgi:hypothetical protein
MKSRSHLFSGSSSRSDKKVLESKLETERRQK